MPVSTDVRGGRWADSKTAVSGVPTLINPRLIAAVLFALLAPIGLAVAQSGPPRPPGAAPAPFLSAVAQLRFECRQQVTAQGVAPDAMPQAVKLCAKEISRPYKRACAKDLRARGYVKRTPEYKAAVRSCLEAQLAGRYPAAPAAGVMATQTPGVIEPLSADEEDVLFGDDE